MAGFSASDYAARPALQVGVRQGISQTTNSNLEDVVIDSVTDRPDKTHTVDVDFTIRIQEGVSTDAVTTALQDTSTLTSELNSALSSESVTISNVVMEETSVVLLGEEDDDEEDDNNTIPIIVGTIAGIGGAVLLVGATVVLCKRRNQPKPASYAKTKTIHDDVRL